MKYTKTKFSVIKKNEKMFNLFCFLIKKIHPIFFQIFTGYLEYGK